MICMRLCSFEGHACGLILQELEICSGGQKLGEIPRFEIGIIAQGPEFMSLLREKSTNQKIPGNPEP